MIKIKISNTVVYSIIGLLIVIIIIIIIYNNYIKKYTKYPTYYRCGRRKLGRVNNKVFNDFNIVKNSNNNWNIYIPCGYNFVEHELVNIVVNNNYYNKFIFGINGCDNIVSKNKIWYLLVKFHGRNNATKLMPESYILDDKNDMKLFKKHYSKNTIYILKKNIQRKEGLKLTKNYFEISNAGKEKYRVVQKYMRNLYLINKRKVNLRIYLLIVIKNNKKQFYLSHKGKCIYTKKEYKDDDFDFEANITSYHLDMNIYKKNPRNFKELSKYFRENGKDPLIFFKNTELLLYYICKAISGHIYQSNNLKGTTSFQLFGLDVIFDKNLHPYLLEFNKGPDMIPRDSIDEKMKLDVQKSMFATVGIIPPFKENCFYSIYNTS